MNEMKKPVNWLILALLVVFLILAVVLLLVHIRRNRSR